MRLLVVLVVTANNYPSWHLQYNLNNINGTFVSDMIVTSPQIQDGVYVTNVPAANQVRLSEDVTLGS